MIKNMRIIGNISEIEPPPMAQVPAGVGSMSPQASANIAEIAP